MTSKPFRFGIVATPPADAAQWSKQVRRAEDLGYSTILTPDIRFTAAPMLSLAAAAAATTSLHLSTWVLSTPNRAPSLVAWETATLDSLSGGRFELGLGAGRPGGEADAAALSMPFGTPKERIEQVRQTIAAVDEWYAADPTTNGYDRRPGTANRPRVMIAGAGPVMLHFAGRHADTVALGLQPTAGEAELGAAVAALVEAGSVAVLQGSVDERCDALIRRREQFGASYITINDGYTEALAPVVERLAGT